MIENMLSLTEDSDRIKPRLTFKFSNREVYKRILLQACLESVRFHVNREKW